MLRMRKRDRNVISIKPHDHIKHYKKASISTFKIKLNLQLTIEALFRLQSDKMRNILGIFSLLAIFIAITVACPPVKQKGDVIVSLTLNIGENNGNGYPSPSSVPIKSGTSSSITEPEKLTEESEESDEIAEEPPHLSLAEANEGTDGPPHPHPHSPSSPPAAASEASSPSYLQRVATATGPQARP